MTSDVCALMFPAVQYDLKKYSMIQKHKSE